MLRRVIAPEAMRWRYGSSAGRACDCPAASAGHWPRPQFSQRAPIAMSLAHGSLLSQQLHFLAPSRLIPSSKRRWLCQRSRCSLSRMGWRLRPQDGCPNSSIGQLRKARSPEGQVRLSLGDPHSPGPDLAREYRAARRPFGCCDPGVRPHPKCLERGLSSSPVLRPRPPASGVWRTDAAAGVGRRRRPLPHPGFAESGVAVELPSAPSRNRVAASVGPRARARFRPGVAGRSFGAR